MQIWNTSSSFGRPANTTASAAGQLVANSTTPGSVVPMSFRLGGNAEPGHTRITRVRLFKDNTSVTLASFRAHFYGLSPTVTNGDGGAYLTNRAAAYLGLMVLDMAAAASPGLRFTDGAVVQGSPGAASEMFIRLTTGHDIFALLEATAAYVPASGEIFTMTVEDVADF